MRVNLTLDEHESNMLLAFSDKEHLAPTTLTKKLLLEFLEAYEDKLWLELALEREKTSSGKFLTHEQVWIRKHV